MGLRSFFLHWRQDLPASLVVFLVALPLCLGVALASGAPLLSGLIAGAVGGLVVGALSGSPLGVSGPAAGLVAIVLTAIGELGGFEEFLLAVVIAGAIQLVLGFARAGIIAYYFPNAVIEGMLAGIGLTIFTKQLPHAVGYDADFFGDESFDQVDHHNTMSELAYMTDGFSLGAIIITLVCLALLILWERPALKKSPLLRFMPGPLAAVLAGIALSNLFAFVPSLSIGAEHFVGLPDLAAAGSFSFPAFNSIGNIAVWKVALTLALVASIESLLCTEATDKLDPWKRTTPTNRELRAQGLGNMVSGLLGGLPITQVVVRSSANIQAGGRTKLSAVLHGLLLVMAALAIPGVLRSIPFAALAAILLVVGYKLIKPSRLVTMWRSGALRFVPYLVTFLGVYFIDLLWGVGLGLAVAIMHILWKNYQTPFHFDPHRYKPGMPILIELSEDVTFLNKAGVKRTLAELPDGCRVVIDASRCYDLDPDVREIIDEFLLTIKDRGIRCELVGYAASDGSSLRGDDLISAVRRFAIGK